MKPDKIELKPQEIKAIWRDIEASPEANSDRFIEAVFDADVWEFGRFRFASGKTANNKFNMEKLALPKNRPQLLVVIAETGKLVVGHEIDAVWGVPWGGQEVFARPLSQVFDVPLIGLIKDIDQPNLKTFMYEDLNAYRIAEQTENKLGLEDASTERGSISGALQLPELLFDTKLMIAGIRRGDPERERKIKVPFEAVFTQYVPNHISIDDPFYQEFGHRAVGEFVDKAKFDIAV
jgi:hypothetical protein